MEPTRDSTTPPAELDTSSYPPYRDPMDAAREMAQEFVDVVHQEKRRNGLVGLVASIAASLYNAGRHVIVDEAVDVAHKLVTAAVAKVEEGLAIVERGVDAAAGAATDVIDSVACACGVPSILGVHSPDRCTNVQGHPFAGTLDAPSGVTIESASDRGDVIASPPSTGATNANEAMSDLGQGQHPKSASDGADLSPVGG